ncbi:hypothetical protein D9758_017867 [Tetrapyrgos nigripes]|uniref:Uncharacterized protein n=1 Tax=Tetrapyrgos nigripes TaxID=182062 RepID=A0A8H5C397_9AGAR|nr:hypothetical protein D9758_017867 [Tetrapyrgos nigripes]
MSLGTHSRSSSSPMSISLSVNDSKPKIPNGMRISILPLAGETDKVAIDFPGTSSKPASLDSRDGYPNSRRLHNLSSDTIGFETIPSNVPGLVKDLRNGLYDLSMAVQQLSGRIDQMSATFIIALEQQENRQNAEIEELTDAITSAIEQGMKSQQTAFLEALEVLTTTIMEKKLEVPVSS